ncbi:response regulator [Alkalibacillus silvisoli]|uniref:Response regulator n=1 Tax=Alkalibacillus silvisoli TaxID=392823 RepID=A0ABP3JSL2_9BACI
MKSILIDDEPLALDYLEHQLLQTKEYEVLGKFSDPYQAQDAIIGSDIDVLFLDIEMRGLNGIELAERLLEHSPHLQIVFVSAYNEYAVKAFELNAVDYLLKPVKLERLAKTTNRIKNQLIESKEQINEQISINLFYEPKVYKGDTVIPLKWRTTKAQQLFYYLIHCRNRTVGKAELIEILWPDFEMGKATTQLYTTIYQVRKTFKSLNDYIKVLNLGDGYSVKLHDVQMDADVFDHFIEKNYSIDEQTIDHYERVVKLFKGDYLQGFDYTWVHYEQLRLRFLWITVKIKVINWYRENGIFDKAMEHALDIYQRFPLEEEGYFELMKTCATTGNSASVMKYYEQLEYMSEQELGVEPSDKIKSWYKNWLKN